MLVGRSSSLNNKKDVVRTTGWATTPTRGVQFNPTVYPWTYSKIGVAESVIRFGVVKTSGMAIFPPPFTNVTKIPLAPTSLLYEDDNQRLEYFRGRIG